MGRNGYMIPEIIKKLLLKGQKSGKELKELVSVELGDNIPKDFKKTFNQALIKLLGEEEIKIVGYDSSFDKRKVKQAFISDPIIFDSSNRLTRPDINDLLIKMNTDNEAYQKIRFKFKSKLKDFNNFEKSRWDFLKSWVFSISPKEIKDILSHNHDLAAIEEKIKNLNEEEERALFLWREDNLEIPTKEESKILMLFNKNYVDLMIGSLLKKISYYDEEKVRIWFYPAIPEEFANDFSCFPRLPELDNFNLLKRASFLAIDNATYPLLFKPFMIDSEGVSTKENALESFGFKKYYDIYDYDLEFEKSIDIISTYSEEQKAILIEILSKGLSDEPGSQKIFWEFYKKISNISYTNRINIVLGVLEKDTKVNSSRYRYENLSEEDQIVMMLKHHVKSIDRFLNYPEPAEE